MPLSPASALAARCCVVTELPHQPRGRAEGNKLTFGQEVDGYVLVKPRAELDGWPLLQTGEPRPMRLTRWLVRAGAGESALHACDKPACIRRAHLSRGSDSTNLTDAHARERRTHQPRMSKEAAAATAAGLATARAARLAAPPFSAAGESAAAAARERVFVTGFASPSKRARLLARAAVAEAAASPLRLEL